ncbi:hypothetical protein A2U01_0067318, partial [Trifolium medium]|nr:hypothetical protein [Trifolium medium]
MALAAANLLYLPDDCWEDVFKFLTCDGARGDYIRVMDSSPNSFSPLPAVSDILSIHTQRRHHLYKRLSIIFQKVPQPHLPQPLRLQHWPPKLPG